MYTVETKKTYTFGLGAINKEKRQLLVDKAIALRDLRNSVSKWICSNFAHFVNISKFDMPKHFKNDNPLISGQDFQHAIYDVYTKYDNKSEAFKSKLNLKIQVGMHSNYYKKKTKFNAAGDLKSFELKMKKTALSQSVSYLAKFYNDGLKEFMLKSLEDGSLDERKTEFYNRILGHWNKYGDRLLNLALSIRDVTISKLIEHPIEFKSLSFNSLNQIKTPIVAYNKNKKSKFNVFITLGAQGENKEVLEIPSKHAKKYHGELKAYQKGANTSYSIVFRDDKPVKIALAIDAKETYATDKLKAIGADVNVKHNLFALSTGDVLDYDRKEFNEFVNFSRRLDEKKKRVKLAHGNKPQPLSKRDQRFLTNWQLRIKSSLKKKCSELVHQIKAEGKDHLVIEDLGTFGVSYIKSEEFEGFKYSRLVRMLNLSDLKNMFQSICNKNDVQLTLVQSHYTSQTCSNCGHVSRDNRQCQEKFICVNCGHSLNADHNAALNIFNRFDSNVLRRELLYQDKLGQYRPKVLKKEFKTKTLSNSRNTVVMKNVANGLKFTII
jgi:transposase